MRAREHTAVPKTKASGISYARFYTFFFFQNLFLFSVYGGFACMLLHLCTTRMPGAQRGQETRRGCQKFQKVVVHSVGAES